MRRLTIDITADPAGLFAIYFFKYARAMISPMAIPMNNNSTSPSLFFDNNTAVIATAGAIPNRAFLGMIRSFFCLPSSSVMIFSFNAPFGFIHLLKVSAKKPKKSIFLPYARNRRMAKLRIDNHESHERTRTIIFSDFSG